MNRYLWVVLTISYLVAISQAEDTATAQIDYSGKIELGLTKTNTDNKAIKDLPPDLSSQIGLMIDGHPYGLNLTGAIEFKYDKRGFEAKTSIPSLSLTISGQQGQLELGDLYPELSRFTLTTLPLRGAQQKLRLLEDRLDLTLLAGQIETASVYEIDLNNNGLLDKDEDINSNLRWDDGGAEYNRYLSGARLVVSPFKVFSSGVTYLLALDDQSSRQTKGTPTSLPLRSAVVAIDTSISILNEFLTLSTEVAKSRKREDGTATKQTDDAYKLTLKADTEVWGMTAEYFQVGGSYTTTFNPGLETDQQGGSIITTWQPKPYIGLVLTGKDYKNNVHLEASETVQTRLISPLLKLSLEKWPTLDLEYQTISEKGSLDTDISKRYIIANLVYSYDQTSLQANYQTFNFEDSSTSTINKYSSDIISFYLNSPIGERLFLSTNLSSTKNNGATEDVSTNAELNLKYELIPERLILSPGYKLARTKQDGTYTLKSDQAMIGLEYNLSTEHQINLQYERKRNEDYFDKSLSYKAKLFTCRYTYIF